MFMPNSFDPTSVGVLDFALVCRIMKRFHGGLVFQAHRLLYHSTLGVESNREDTSRGLGFGVGGVHRELGTPHREFRNILHDIIHMILI